MKIKGRPLEKTQVIAAKYYFIAERENVLTRAPVFTSSIVSDIAYSTADIKVIRKEKS